jgi:sialate O-acetylesterase
MEPKYVRYGWKDVPVVNLYNSAGLPASPFSSEELLPDVN